MVSPRKPREPRRSDEALRQRVYALVDSTPAGIFIKDSEGRYVFVNRAIAEAFHCRPEDWIGKTDHDLFPRQMAERLVENDRAVLAKGGPMRFPERTQSADRQYHMLNLKFPVRDGDGEMLLGGVALDFSEQTRAEATVRSLLRVGEKLSSTLDVDRLLDILVAEALYLADAQGGLAGLATAQGMLCSTWHRDGGAMPLEYCWPALHGWPGWVLVHKTPYLCNDARHDVQCVPELCARLGVRSVLCMPILDSQRNPIGFVELHNKRASGFGQHDLDALIGVAQLAATSIQNALAYRKLQQVEAMLKEADRRKDDFLATLAHELRNPLAPIRNAVQVMRMKGRLDGDLEAARDMVDRQMQQLVHLVDDLLDVSRISRGKLQLRRQTVNLAEVLHAAVETTRPLIDSRGHRLEVALPAQPLYVDADLMRLAQVFANLLDNAAKYTDPGGRLCVTLTAEDGNAAVAVADDGIGIAAERLPHIFETFSQSTPALERSHGGLGIGLSLTRELVRMHGGSIAARSAGAGRGSEFVVRLPLVAVPASQRGPSPEESIRRAGHGKRILVADDNHDAADSLAMLLSAAGHEVHTAYDGLQAVEDAARLKPDVVVLDIGMPKLNGYQAAERIRAQPWGKTTLLVALTGWGQDSEKQRAQRAGFDHHVTKPADPFALQALFNV